MSTPNPGLFTSNTNVSHGEKAPVITNEAPAELQFFQFGFTPFWAQKQFYMINARAEGDHNKEDNPAYTGMRGIINKPMFRKSIRSKRCLVVADAFIEGPKKEKLSKPFVVYLKDKVRPFAMAGIWDEWVNQQTGEVIKSFAVITTVSNDLLQRVGHHRSPVVLRPEQERAWLDTELPLSEVTAMLDPYDASLMNAYPIDPAIKNPRANGMDLIKPVGERIYKEYEYEIYEEVKLFGMGESRRKSEN